ncbi:MAG: M23 family metallopeptidase [Rhodospirillaceae bacterium]|nr:M23 family metallopeptidase [Rhodospirillaceae bacterium]
MKAIMIIIVKIFLSILVLFMGAGNSFAAGSISFEGNFTQGGLVLGEAPPGTLLKLSGKDVTVAKNGTFIFGFGRNAGSDANLEIKFPGGRAETRRLTIAAREYDIQRIDGLPSRKVTPKPEDVARIKADNYKIGEVRATVNELTNFLSGFGWPVTGTISGVYGSQRILNGNPKNPHNGVDIAAPKGSVIKSPADGIVALVHQDMFYTGKTMMINHGLGLSTVYAHMDDISVTEGQMVKKGEPIGTVGNTGRTTGPHLHWGMTWKFTHLDPGLVVGPMSQHKN